MCTANRNVSAAVNSSAEFNCSPNCLSNVSWSYVSLTSSVHQPSRSLLTPTCLGERRCQINAKQQSVFSIGQIQFKDAGMYLCSSGTKNQPDYCEESFNFTGKFLYINMPGSILFSVIKDNHLF